MNVYFAAHCSPFVVAATNGSLSSVHWGSLVSGRAGYQPSPAADGAISLGDGLGRHAVPLQPGLAFG